MDDPHLRAPSAACQKLGEVEHQSGRADDKSVFPDAGYPPARHRTLAF